MTDSRSPAPPPQFLRILVAESDAVNQALAQAVLESLGHEAVLVADGEAALQAMVTGAFDAAFLSLQLPGMDGLETARHLRASATPGAARVPILGMSGSEAPADLALCRTVGMDDCVAKPLRRTTVAAALENALVRFTADTVDLAGALAMMAGQPRYLARMVMAALATLPRSVGDARLHLEARDWRELEQVAHAMKGALAALLAKPAAASARLLEEAARAAWLPQATQALTTLETQTRALLPALEEALRPGGLACEHPPDATANAGAEAPAQR